MTIKEWLDIFKEERELLINKTKWGVYATVLVLVPTMINVIVILSQREYYLLQQIGFYILEITIALLLAVIVIGSLFLIVFIFRNYWRYQKIELIVDKIFSGEIKNDEDFYDNYQEKYVSKSENKDKSKKSLK